MRKSLICAVNELLLWLLTGRRPHGPTPHSRRAAPSPGRRRSRDDGPSPAPFFDPFCSPQLQNRHPHFPPPASPQSCFPAPGEPWPATLFPGTVFVSSPPAASLSPHLRPSPGPSPSPTQTMQAVRGWGPRPACEVAAPSWEGRGPHAPCHLSDCHSPTSSWVHNTPAVCPQPPLPFRAAGCPPCSPTLFAPHREVA